MLKLKIPPPIYMLLVAALMWWIDKYLPIFEQTFATWHKFGYLFIITAVMIEGSSLLQFFQAHTSINPLHPEKADKLVITGMYQYSRNPMYVGLLFLLIGWAFLLDGLSPFFMLPVFTVILTKQQIIPEEKILEQKFGQPYRDYMQSVKRWL